MRKRFHHERVASCSPRKGLSSIDGRVFTQQLAEAEREINGAKRAINKFSILERTGDLCCEAGHPLRAFTYWERALEVCYDADYEELTFAFANKARTLGWKMDATWRRCFPGREPLKKYYADVLLAYKDIFWLRLGE